jgi:Flp pilus assembly protein TadB
MLDGAKTLIGVLIAALPTLATLLGYDTSPDLTGDLTEIGAGIMTIIGVGVAIYGRIVANGPMWFTKRK